MLGWFELKEEIGKLHELPILLPDEFIRGTVLPVIGIVAIILTVVYVISFSIITKHLPDIPGQRKTRICYQITNVVFNLFVGLVGVYLEYWILPTLTSHYGTSLDRIPLNHEELYLVSAMQLGYQLWAIPVGVLYVGESFQMIMHHLAVVVSTSMSGFMTVGFRYYTPFFYGIMELSSLPLSLMNTFKDNPEWIKQYPGTYQVIRVLFAVSFLLIRVVLCATRWPLFLRDNFVFMYTGEMGLYKIYLITQWLLAAFLAYLQLHWAMLIVKGVYKMAAGGKSDKKKE